jgi:tetratricopeptide (TPR) repeat protein
VKQELNDKKGIATTMNNIGALYEAMGNYPEALNSFVSSLDIRTELHDKKGVSTCHNNIGVIYMRLGMRRNR